MLLDRDADQPGGLWGGTAQITTKLASLVKHIIIKAGVSRSIPRFLAAKPAVIRLTVAHKLLQLATSSKLSLLKTILFPAVLQVGGQPIRVNR